MFDTGVLLASFRVHSFNPGKRVSMELIVKRIKTFFGGVVTVFTNERINEERPFSVCGT